MLRAPAYDLTSFAASISGMLVRLIIVFDSEIYLGIFLRGQLFWESLQYWLGWTGLPGLFLARFGA